MGMFDDLIPKKSGGMFDDLIPDKEQEEQQKGFDYKSAAYAVPGLANADKFEQMTPEQQEQQKQDKVNMARATAQGALFGNADEAEAVFRSMFSDKTYTEARDSIRAQNAEFKEREPVVAGALEIGGGLSTGLAGGAKTVAATASKKAIQKIATGAATGAAAGAVGGAGYSDAELASGEFVEDVATGAAIGVAAGAGMSGLQAFVQNKAAKNEVLRNRILNNPDSTVAKKTLDGAGKLVKDKSATEAIRQGFDDGVVAMVKATDGKTKQQMRRMVNIYRKAKADPKLAIRSRPADVLGESVSKRYRYVYNQKKKAGEAIDAASEGLKGQQVDYAPVVDDFVNTLDDAGVKLSTDKGKVTLDFAGSDFEGLGAAQRIIKRVVSRMSDTRPPDAHDVHRMKRYLDNNVSFGASNKTGAERQAESIIKGLRHKFDELLDGKFASYDQANSRYATAVNALNEVDSLLGKNTNQNSRNFEKSLGTLSRRISSNAISGGRVDDSLLQLSEAADSLGGSFSDDFDSLVVLANEIERVLPTQARTSLQGQTSNVAEQISRKGVTERALDAAAGLYDSARGVNPDNQLSALRRLLIE